MPRANPDALASAGLGLVLLAELVTHLAADASLLAQVPPSAAALLLAAAAFVRWRLGARTAGAPS